jgi:hypothetical protein
MMKTRYLSFIIVCFVIAGCASQRSNFADFSAYLDQTDPALPDAAGFADRFYPLCNREDASIPFLKTKLTSTKPSDQIAAYTALGLLVDLITRNPTPDGLVHLAIIEPESILALFSEYETSQLSDNMKAWLTRTNKMPERDLEQKIEPVP